MTGRKTPPAAVLGGILDRAATSPGPAGDVDQKQPPAPPPEVQPPPVPVTPPQIPGAAQTAPDGGKAKRLNVRVPPGVKTRLERQQRRAGLSYTEIVLDAYRAHGAELPPPFPGDPVAADDPGDPLQLPARSTLARSRRRRHVHGVDLPLYVFPQERAVLEAAVTAGRALNLSDLVTRVLDLALPPAGRRSGS